MASIQQTDTAWLVQWTDPATRKRKTRRFSRRVAAERFRVDRDSDRELVREGLATARQVTEQRYVLTVDELCERFISHARTYYVKNGRQTRTFGNFTDAVKPLRRLYGSSAAADFGPLSLKRVRDKMISAGWSRGTVNQQIGRIRAVFKWGVEQEMIPPIVLEGLRAVSPLKRGRCDARETEPVRPVPVAHIRAVRRHLSGQVWAMIELQRLTGMRPGEVLLMRTGDLGMSDDAVWTYTPVEHKTEHHGHGRKVFIGPRAQIILRPFLRPDLTAFMFSPREAEQGRRAADAKGHRRPGQPETKRQTSRRIGDRYTTESYRRAINRACDLAGVPAWSPNQLRHNHGTRIRRDFGLDVAQTILGHRLGSTVTEIYAEANTRKARQVIAKVG